MWNRVVRDTSMSSISTHGANSIVEEVYQFIYWLLLHLSVLNLSYSLFLSTFSSLEKKQKKRNKALFLHRPISRQTCLYGWESRRSVYGSWCISLHLYALVFLFLSFSDACENGSPMTLRSPRSSAFLSCPDLSFFLLFSSLLFFVSFFLVDVWAPS